MYKFKIIIGLVGQCVRTLPSNTKKSAQVACSSYCLNGATCLGKDSNVTCLCPSGYGGLKIYFYYYYSFMKFIKLL